MEKVIRCEWCEISDLYRKYHDEEWGIPVFNDQKMFEFLVLESAQAGLSWITILKRREGYRKAFHSFIAEEVASFDQNKIEELMLDSSIIRNRRKIESAVNNARCFLAIQKEFGTFCNYIWGFINHSPIQNHYDTLAEVPAQTELSQKISRDMKKRGFTFLGPTVMYAHMQATGMVNDHLVGCFRHKQISLL